MHFARHELLLAQGNAKSKASQSRVYDETCEAYKLKSCAGKGGPPAIVHVNGVDPKMYFLRASEGNICLLRCVTFASEVSMW